MKIQGASLKHPHGAITELLLPQNAQIIGITEDVFGYPMLDYLVMDDEQAALAPIRFLTLHRGQEAQVDFKFIKYIGCVFAETGLYYCFEIRDT